MATSIGGIPTTRVSDQFIRTRLLRQTQYDQAELFRIQTRLSTGRRFDAPSEDPVASLRAMSLQRLLERKVQVRSNITTSGSYLTNTDVTLSETSSILADIRGEALTVTGTVANQEQRQAVVQQVDEALKQLVDTGNQKFRGRYLFAGARTATEPFTWTDEGKVQYDGDEDHLEAYGDIDLLFQSNLTGSEVFGAVSEPRRGTADLNPVFTYDTPLEDIRHGRGLSKGSITISDGTNISTVDLSSAQTVGDVLELIKNHPPAGREVYVGITENAVTVELDPQPGTSLTILEVGGGTVAHELGILEETGVGNGRITGRDLDPTLGKTTELADLFGVRSWALLRSDGADSNVRVEADVRGTHTDDGVALNGLNISLVDDPLLDVGQEVVDYQPGAGTMTVYIDEGFTTAAHLVDAINNAADLPYTASVDPLDDVSGGLGAVTAGATATTAEGSGEEFDKHSGLRVVNKDDTFNISFSSAETVEDMLNTINGFGAGLLAEINDQQRGIDVRSRVSGTDFMIGENGGTTAAQLGLRSHTRQTRLEELNFGRGVDTAEGTDFTIRLARGGPALEADISDLDTIGAVIDHLNTLDPELEARLAQYGNGIELVDTSAGAQPLSVERTVMSRAAIDLGFIPEGYQTAGNNGLGMPTATDPSDPPLTAGGGPTAAAEALVASTGKNNDLLFRSRSLGAADNGVAIHLVDNDGTAAPSVTSYTPGTEITIEFDQGVHTANDIITAVQADPAADADWQVLLHAPNQDDSFPPTHAGQPEALLTSPGPDNDLLFQSVEPGGEYNGTAVIFDGTRPPGVTWDPDAKTLTFGISGGRTAQQIIADLTGDPVASTLFTAALDPTDTVNDGDGDVADNTASPPETAGGSPTQLSTATVTSPGTDNDMTFTASSAGTSYNDTRIELVDNPGSGAATVTDYTAGILLRIRFDSTAAHTAQDIQAAVAAHGAAGADWTVTFDPDDALPNSGLANVGDNAPGGVAMTGGTQTLTAADTNRQEAESIFTALLRLKDGLEQGDNYEVQRAVNVLDRATIDMNFARAELGANQQSLEVLGTRLDDEEVELRTILSQEIDADMVDVISELSARQAAFEASLRAMGSIFQMSLLNYL